MEKRILYTIITIVVVVVLAFSIYQFSGEFIYRGEAKGCLDTDADENSAEGLNFLEKGTVTYTNRDVKFTDYCYRTAEVKEYYCEGGIRIRSTLKGCSEVDMDTCVDGACVKQAKQS